MTILSAGQTPEAELYRHRESYVGTMGICLAGYDRSKPQDLNRASGTLLSPLCKVTLLNISGSLLSGSAQPMPSLFVRTCSPGWARVDSCQGPEERQVLHVLKVLFDPLEPSGPAMMIMDACIRKAPTATDDASAMLNACKNV